MLTLAIVCLAGCGSPAERPEQPPEPVSWTPVAEWSGRGNRQTETFTMFQHLWRLRWEATAGSSDIPPTLRVTVHSADSGRLLDAPLDERGAGSGIVEIVEEPRQFYLTIESTGLEWTLAVEDSVPAR